MTHPIAYTDGACLGNPGPGGWGVRILYPDGLVREYGGAAAATTNNRMELQGAIEALKMLGAAPQATIHTDSRYVIDGLTRWIHSWRRRGWQTTAHTPVKNRDLWLVLDRLQHAGIRWRHVRGHSGNPNNERVDTIARLFARGTPPQLFCGPGGVPPDPVTTMPPDQATATTGVANQPASRHHRAARYASIVHGTLAIDEDWHTCAGRVRGVSGALYKKVHSAVELAEFCAKHGIIPPPGAWEGG
jgi:ribonuclease HI